MSNNKTMKTKQVFFLTLMIIQLQGCTLLGAAVDRSECNKEDDERECSLDNTIEGVKADISMLKALNESNDNKRDAPPPPIISTSETESVVCEEDTIQECSLVTKKCTCKSHGE